MRTEPRLFEDWRQKLIYDVRMHRLMLVFLCLGLTLGLCLGGCSNRPAPHDSGPKWPDFRRDLGDRVDRGSRADLPPRPDVSSLDHRLWDAPRPDLDLALIDGVRPDLPQLPGWEQSQLSSVDLHDVTCVQGHVYAVGAGGAIYHHTPGTPPDSFLPQVSNTAADLYTVSFADLTYGAAAGQDHQIWETRDQGQTWSVAPQCSTFIFEAFHALHLHSAAEGYGAGVAINGLGAGFKFFGGGSWVCGPGIYADNIFYGVFRQGARGWIVGDTAGQILRTLDGNDWSYVNAGTPWILRDIHFTPNGIGVAVGHEGSIVRSSDGDGTTWSSISSSTKGNLMAIAFSGELKGWIVGAGGQILHTLDGGQTWAAQDSGTYTNLTGVCFSSPTAGWAVGAGGMLLFTESGGIQ